MSSSIEIQRQTRQRARRGLFGWVLIWVFSLVLGAALLIVTSMVDVALSQSGMLELLSVPSTPTVGGLRVLAEVGLATLATAAVCVAAMVAVARSMLGEGSRIPASSVAEQIIVLRPTGSQVALTTWYGLLPLFPLAAFCVLTLLGIQFSTNELILSPIDAVWTSGVVRALQFGALALTPSLAIASLAAGAFVHPSILRLSPAGAFVRTMRSRRAEPARIRDRLVRPTDENTPVAGYLPDEAMDEVQEWIANLFEVGSLSPEEQAERDALLAGVSGVRQPHAPCQTNEAAPEANSTPARARRAASERSTERSP